MSDKKVVNYVPMEYDHIVLGEPAIINNVVDHPSERVSNRPGQAVYTTPVIRIDGTTFETRNTIYKG